MDPIPAKLNTKQVLDKRDHIEMLNAVLAKSWPTQARKHVTGKDGKQGHGSCLGVTYEKGDVRLGHYTLQYDDLVKYLNNMLAKYYSDFRWTSIQVNVNTISDKHRDSNNTGPSIMFVLGMFSKGIFRSSDPECPKVGPGEVV